jgi:hypothetical protein
MFRSVSWHQYITFLFAALAFFYGWLHIRFNIFQPFVDRIKRIIGRPTPPPAQPPVESSTTTPAEPEPKKDSKPPTQTTLFLIALLATSTATAQTADGNAGINQANTLIRSYFTTAVQLMYAISALIGIAGAIHVYVKMLRGHHDTQQAATAWFSACIFIAVVATVIQFFFGL